jgi:hypothetical protein
VSSGSYPLPALSVHVPGRNSFGVRLGAGTLEPASNKPTPLRLVISSTRKPIEKNRIRFELDETELSFALRG